MATTGKGKQSSVKYYVISGICIFLMFFGGLIPPFAPVITKMGMQILGIFVGLIILWSTVGGVIWPSILAIIALGLTEYTTVGAACTSALGQSVIWQLLVCLVLTSAISQSGAGQYLGRWFLSRKVFYHRPMLFTWAFITGFTLISTMSSMGMMLLAWAILKGMASVTGKEMTEPYFKKMSVMMMISCAFGEFVLPYKSWVSALWNTFSKVSGKELEYLPYIAVTLCFGLLMNVFMALYIKVTKTDMEFLNEFDNTKLNEGSADSLSIRQKSFMLAMLICVLLSACSSLLPAGNAVRTFTSTLTTGGIFAIASCLLMIIKDKEGKPLMNFTQVMSSGTLWGPIWICAAAVPIASALCSEGTGFMAWASSILNPIFAGSSIWMIYLVIIVSSVILTNLGSNTGIAMMMLPIVLPLAAEAGANMYAIGICTIYSACYGFVLPGASAVAAMMYGVKEDQGLESKDIIKTTFAMCICYCVLGAIIFPILDGILPPV